MKTKGEHVVMSLERFKQHQREIDELVSENRKLKIENEILKEGEKGVESYIVQMPIKMWDALSGNCDVQINVKKHAVQAALIKALEESKKNIAGCEKLISAQKVDIKEMMAEIQREKGKGIYFPIWVEVGIIASLTLLGFVMWH